MHASDERFADPRRRLSGRYLRVISTGVIRPPGVTWLMIILE